MAKAKTSSTTKAAKTAAKKAPAKKAAAKKAPAKKTQAKKAATSKVKVKNASPVTDDQIAARAYQIWQEQGCPDGRADEHWAQAVGELTA